MKLISLNVALPRIVEWNGEPVTTGIFKEPLPGPVMLRKLNLDGDRQADLSVHGGISKAVSPTLRSTMTFGGRNCLRWSCQTGCSAKITIHDY